jgi:acetyl esterase
MGVDQPADGKSGFPFAGTRRNVTRMKSSPVAEYLQHRLAALATRMPLAWINLLTGAPRTCDGRTLDARTQWLLNVIERSGQPPLHRLHLAAARAEYEASMKLLSGNWLPDSMLWGGAPHLGEVVDRTISGPAGRIPLRIYHPAATNAGRQPPAILWLHGGGWVLGSLDAYDAPCRFLAARSEAVVVAVDYRLAPEHRFPAGLDDCRAAWQWLAAETAALGADPARLVLAGDDAGGNLAAVLAQELRAEAAAPAFQLLLYPICDLAMSTASMASCGEGYLLTREMLEWCRSHYLSDPAQATDPRVSPLLAADLSGIAPAMVVTAGFDPVRDEGRAYADRLQAAGAKTVHREFETLIHGFIGMRGTLQAAARAMDEIAAGLRHELATLGQ